MSEDRAYMRRYMTERYHRRRSEWIKKLGGICVNCSTAENLEFDHIDSKEKSFSVGRAFSGWSDKRLEAEVSKCQLLCSRCHLRKSYTSGDILLPITEHGTLAMYQKKFCRCDLCRAANAKASREYKARRRSAMKALNETFGL